MKKVNRFKSFLNMIKYESLMILRNKTFLAILLLLGICVVVVMSIINNIPKNYMVCINTNGLDREDVIAIEVLDSELKDYTLEYVKTNDEGIDKVNKNESILFLDIKVKDEVQFATIYYNSAISSAYMVKDTIKQGEIEFAYQMIINILDEFGLKIDTEKIDLFEIEPTIQNDMSNLKVTFSWQVAACIACVIMFGIAYSTARNNEFNVSKNISYLPMGVNGQIMSKSIPYILIGFIEFVILLTLGKFLYGINFQFNMLVIMVVGLMFILSCTMQGLIFGLVKNQITSTILSFFVIVVPMIMSSMMSFSTLPFVLKIIFGVFSMFPFMECLTALSYNGVFIWENFVVLIIGMVFYYLIAYYFTRRRVYK